MSKVLVCVNCGKEFKLGAWYNCEDNPTRKHIVESKTYYSDSDSLVVNAIPQTSMIGNQGERINVPGVVVTFTNGTFHTVDPEIQEVLDRRVTMSKEAWMEKRLTPELRTGRDRAVISQQQALIDELKAKNAALEAAQRSDTEQPDEVMAGAKGKAKTARN